MCSPRRACPDAVRGGPVDRQVNGVPSLRCEPLPNDRVQVANRRTVQQLRRRDTGLQAEVDGDAVALVRADAVGDGVDREPLLVAGRDDPVELLAGDRPSRPIQCGQQVGDRHPPGWVEREADACRIVTQHLRQRFGGTHVTSLRATPAGANRLAPDSALSRRSLGTYAPVVMTSFEDLRKARARLPVGSRVTGSVSRVPWPGAVGIFIELKDATEGFVDVLTLPVDPQLWPAVGAVAEFEVLQHTVGQVRLWPLDPPWCSRPLPPLHTSDEAWARTRSRYNVGEIVTARTRNVYSSNRTYGVAFDDQSAVLEWWDERPVVGTIGTYRITAVLDTTRRVLLTPAD